MTTVVGTRRFTVEEYHRMAEVGIFKPDDRLELLDGDIIPMAPMSSRHAAAVSKITEWMQPAFAGRALIRVQCPIRLDEHSEPEPDVALMRTKADRYAEAHPTPRDVFLVIEVAQCSLGFDRDLKVPQYAKAGVPEVWLVNLEAQQIELFRQPGPLGYGAKSIVRKGQTFAPQEFPDAAVAVDDLLA